MVGRFGIGAWVVAVFVAGCSASGGDTAAPVLSDVPSTRWAHQPGHQLWNASALAALDTHASALTEIVPDDIATWCPDYPNQGAAGRSAFWVGFLSALSKHESTYNPAAVGGGGQWFGLLQISPATARGYQCRAGSGAQLQNGAANVSCGLRIMAVTVPRDGVIATRDTRWRGVAADWGPMRDAAKRQDMIDWLSRQSYCRAG